MDLRISNRLNQPTFQRLIWDEKCRENTQYAISEVMRQDRYNKGSISFEVLEDQFNKIDDLKEDVVLSCSYYGSEAEDYKSGSFNMLAQNKRGNLLADLRVGVNFEPKSANEKIAGFYHLVKSKIENLNNARHLSKEQRFYYESADDYMKIFDKRA